MPTLPAIPELTVPPGRSGGAQPDVALHRAALSGGQTTNWFGVPVTSVARTAIDIARLHHHAGLVTADSALRERLVTRADLRPAAVAANGWPGSRYARWVVDHADPLAESALESLTRACLLAGGLPKPELQVRIRDRSDGWRCRVDMLYRAERLVVEADGRLKYTDDELWREKIPPGAA